MSTKNDRSIREGCGALIKLSGAFKRQKSLSVLELSCLEFFQLIKLCVAVKYFKFFCFTLWVYFFC